MYGTATAAVALMLSGCPARTVIEPVKALYGPEPTEEQPIDDVGTVIDDVEEPIEDVYGSPIPDELVDVNETDEDGEPILYVLYGPAPDFETDADAAD